jgi:hypothetical protein
MVGHEHPHGSPAEAASDFDLPSRRRELGRVRQEIRQHLEQAAGIDIHHDLGQRLYYLQPYIAGLSVASIFLHGLFHQRHESLDG